MAAYVSADHALAERDVVTPADVRDERIVMFPRRLIPSLYDWWLARIEGAGYRFRAVYHAGGGDPQDLMAAVAEGQGIGFATREFADAGNIGTHAVARQLDPPVSVPAKVIAWRADYPAQIAPIIDTMREAARELRSKTSV